MPRVVQYLILFAVVIALQIFLFDNLYLSIYLHSFVYLAFILLLPMEIKGHLLLVLAAVTGIVMDFFSGVPGVHTIATVAMAFCRPGILRFFAGKDMVNDGGVPNVEKLGAGKFFRYASVLVTLHAIVFFVLETLTFTGALLTALRIVVSVVFSLTVIWLVQLLFTSRKTQAY